MNDRPTAEAGAVVPPCRVCHLNKDVICYPDDHSQTICPECCGKTEHPDGETTHRFVYVRGECDWQCTYCGVSRSCTDWEPDFDE